MSSTTSPRTGENPPREEAGSWHRHALAVRHRSAGGRGDAGWTEAIHERGQHRWMEPAAARRGTVEPAAHGEEVEAIADGPTDQCGGEAKVGTRVGVERHDPFTRRRGDALLECPSLAGPPRRQRRADDDRGARCPCNGGGAVGRLVVHHDHLVDTWRADHGGQHRSDSGVLVACGNDHRDRLSRGDRRPYRRRRARRLHQSTERDSRGADARQQRNESSDPERQRPHCADHRRSCSIISATMRALVATSGRPPPGWLDPPTRYRPSRAPRLAGRANAARRPFDEVP